MNVSALKSTTTHNARRAGRTMNNTSAKISALIDDLDPKAQKALVAFLTSIIGDGDANNLDDVEDAAPRRRRTAAKEEKPASKPTRRSRAAAEEEDEKPSRRSRKPVGPTLEEVSVDGIYDFLSEFAEADGVVPVPGGLRELTAAVKAKGADPRALTEGYETRAERTEALGLYLASLEALKVALKKASDDELDEVADELGVEGKTKRALVDAIVDYFIGSPEEVDEDDDEEPGDDDAGEEPADDLDDLEDEPAPRRRRSAA